MKKRIVITGIGVVTPIGIGKEAYVEARRQGKPGANRIGHFDPSAFTAQICASVKDFQAENYMEKKKARRMARFTQLGLAAASMAITDSGLDLTKEDRSRIGVITGTGMGGLDVIEEEEKVLLERVGLFL
jgi:3-oxoacyl-[acyl-carrier-protein] synthase II